MKMIKAFLMLSCIATNFEYLYFENQLSLISIGIVFGFYFLASAIHLLVHEGGHLIGGLLSGYKLLCLQLGPLNIIIGKYGMPTFLWKKTHGGQCIMFPTNKKNVRFKAYNMGGVFANILIVLLSLLLLIPSVFYAKLLLIELLFVGAYKIISNSIPHKFNSMLNDGYIVMLLNRDKAIQKDYAIYLKLYAALFLGESISTCDYVYERKPSKDNDELLYYNEIQNLLQSIDSKVD